MSDLRLLSREFLSEFIDLYRENECLWKIKSKEYSDKNKKTAAYNILINKLKEVDAAANRDMVVKKINSLRTCFRKELKKYNASLESGIGTEDIQKPNLWYFDLLLFLTDQETPRQNDRDTMEMEEIIASPRSESSQDMENVEDPLGNTTTPSVSQLSSMTTSSTAKRIKRDRSDEAPDIIAKSVQSHTAAESIGRYSFYGQHIAQELEELSPNMAIHCKKMINDAIYHAQLGNLTSHSKIVNDPKPVVHNN